MTLRNIFKTYHQVEIGMYSHGGCFTPGSMPPGTTIGRYCSIAFGTAALLNHPLNYKSTHAFFFNPQLGYVTENPLHKTNFSIGNDVWIGQNTLILPGCSRIGDGAVIGAGSVVNKDIPPYSVAVGNPCRVIQHRFTQEIAEGLISTRWWEKSITDLQEELNSFKTIIKEDDAE